MKHIGCWPVVTLSETKGPPKSESGRIHDLQSYFRAVVVHTLTRAWAYRDNCAIGPWADASLSLSMTRIDNCVGREYPFFTAAPNQNRSWQPLSRLP
ncbi:MAG: hypothetical protein LLG42_05880 [Chloroflexi bacterium]|nr:hypothetical protein [Chloroflexota bacterium]